MKFPHLLYIFIAIALLSCTSSTSTEQESTSSKPQWQSLFNGKNLDGWEIKINGFEVGENYANTFSVEDGLLKISYDDYDSYGTKYGALYTTKSFTNYRLKVEYRFVGDTAKNAPSWGFRDSGIQYHCQSAASMKKDQPFPVCLEYNLHGGDGTNERPVGQICTIGTRVDIAGKESTAFCTPPEVSKTFHGDQWVVAEIDVKGDTISQWVNGEKLIEFTNPRLDPVHEWGKTLITEGNTSLGLGHISLQSNSHPIQFRKIEIMEYQE